MVTIDQERNNFHPGRIVIYIRDNLVQTLSKGALSIERVVIAKVKQLAGNSKIFWYYSVEDKDLI